MSSSLRRPDSVCHSRIPYRLPGSPEISRGFSSRLCANSTELLRQS
jgi:hypothetical protein